jgi:diacylglycerol kinase (ATP)
MLSPLRILKAFGYSLDGLKAAWKSEQSFRDEVLISLLLIPLALKLGRNTIEESLLIGSWLLVPIVELLNTGIEVLVERINPELHPLSKKAKDVGSAAVLLAMALALFIWLRLLLFRV